VLEKCEVADAAVRAKLGVAPGSAVPIHQKELYSAMMIALSQYPEVGEKHAQPQPSEALIKWAQRDPMDLENFSCLKAFSEVGYGPGGPEAVSTELRTLMMDADGSGDITEEELDATAESVTSSINTLLMNMGVVGALLLSIVMPLVFTPLEPAESTIEFFGEITAKVFGYLYHILITLCLFLCLDVIFQTICAYKWLNFWMVSSEMKLFAGRRFNNTLVVNIIGAGQAILWLIPCSVPFGCVTYISPIAGAYSLVILLLMMAKFMVFFQKNEFFYSAYLHVVARQLVGHTNTHN
jgi:hypothetical protein